MSKLSKCSICGTKSEFLKRNMFCICLVKEGTILDLDTKKELRKRYSTERKHFISKRKKSRASGKSVKPTKDKFYSSRHWRELRYDILVKYKATCCLCGSTKKPIHVDHIVPISKDPSRKLDSSNLQLLCADCNLGKSNRYCIDHTNDKWTKSSKTAVDTYKIKRYDIDGKLKSVDTIIKKPLIT